MVLRPESVRSRLRKLEEVLSELERIAPEAGSSVRDEWAVERGLQLAAETLFDVGNHILTAHFGVSAEDYEDVLEQLARRNVIPQALREKFRGLGGFRNLLVHDYLRVDPVRVRDFAGRAPAEFAEFARSVEDWIASIERSDE